MTEPPPERATLSTLRRLAPYVRPHRWTLLAGGAAALAGTLAGLTIPLVTRAIVDGPITRGERDTLPWLVLGVLALGAGEAVLMFLRRRLVARPSTGIEAAMRTDLYAHLQRLPVSFHDGWPSGQLLSRATGDLNTIRWFVAFSGIFLVVNVLTVLVGIGVLLWLSVSLGVVIAITAVPLLVLTLLLERRFSVEARRAQDQAGDLTTVVEESALGIRVLKSLGRGRRLSRRFVADARGLRGTELLKIRLIAALWAVLVMLPESAIAVVLGLGAWGVAAGSLTIGTLVAAVTVMTYLYWPIASIGWLLAEASNAAAATKRYWEVRDVTPEILDPADPQPMPRPVRGALELRDVRFRYPGGDRDILRGVDLSVRPGETLALVGATGSGKTTLTALVTRLHDVTGGAVLLDGVDVRLLRLSDLRAAVATAFEDPVLISASVRENVLLGSPGHSDDQVWEALRIASADGFVAALPWGLDTRIGEQGMSLSGGQRQRLALARAVVGHPPVLVLDDPLSALDVHTEAEVEAALRRVLGGVTALVVAHRPSTVQLADRVALLDGGRITAVGTHTTLLATVPEYRRLLASPAVDTAGDTVEDREGVEA
ncbi:ABC transporter ATP-binding protein/permease [Pseudonocardia sp. DSM 110487]|uniref:ABC transporter ATP-binding protein n=1 Tax=Pseudonocardia sp. DSM 110487 TaxID=2865833 RepID=UPI001C69E6BE|nr:ABC transporter ATP-binding protein [Pseudonocardia sp. DSM 110487]QYN31828.1 ABC transporter ATP-binding protein/permease [Pseudonocardia sp. DSM 110487]